MYENETFENLLNAAEADIDSKAPVQTGEGSLVYNALAALAYELEKLYIQLDYINTQGHATTADIEHLVLFAADHSLTRNPATRAVVSAQGNVAIPSGTRVSLKGYIYDIGDVIDDSLHTYKATCETAGSAANITGVATIIDYVEGLTSVTITEVLIPGEDIESRESLLERYRNSFTDTSFGGNIAAYKKAVLAVDGVGAVRVKRAWNQDINPESFIPTDAVTTWYKSLTGLSDEVKTWLDAVYTAASQRLLTVGGTVLVTVMDSDYGAASSELVETVQNVLDPGAGDGSGEAPIGHVVTVQSATAVSVAVAATLTFEDGYTIDNTKEAIDEAISEYLLGLREAWANGTDCLVRIRQIEARILSVTGVVDITGLTINGSADNLTLDEASIPIYGGFTNG